MSTVTYSGNQGATTARASTDPDFGPHTIHDASSDRHFVANGAARMCARAGLSAETHVDTATYAGQPATKAVTNISHLGFSIDKTERTGPDRGSVKDEMVDLDAPCTLIADKAAIRRPQPKRAFNPGGMQRLLAGVIDE